LEVPGLIRGGSGSRRDDSRASTTAIARRPVLPTAGKNGTPSTHPLIGDEMRALRRLQRESPASPFIFVSERGSPFTTAGFARMVERAAAAARLEIKAHPHMLAPKRRYERFDFGVAMNRRSDRRHFERSCGSLECGQVI
jgi:hypothetical protein